MDDVSWVILRVTHVSGPQQLWAEFSIDKKMEEHRDILKYHNAVSNKYGSMMYCSLSVLCMCVCVLVQYISTAATAIQVT